MGPPGLTCTAGRISWWEGSSQRRLLVAIPVVLVATFVVFLLVSARGDPLQDLRLTPGASEATVENLEREYHLDEPLLERYGSWLADFVQGDWGTSFATERPVGDMVRTAAWNSFLLAGTAVAFSVVLAVVLGVVSAARAANRVRLHRDRLRLLRVLDARLLLRTAPAARARGVAARAVRRADLLRAGEVQRGGGGQPREPPPAHGATRGDADAHLGGRVESLPARQHARRAAKRLRAHRTRNRSAAGAHHPAPRAPQRARPVRHRRRDRHRRAPRWCGGGRADLRLARPRAAVLPGAGALRLPRAPRLDCARDRVRRGVQPGRRRDLRLPRPTDPGVVEGRGRHEHACG